MQPMTPYADRAVHPREIAETCLGAGLATGLLVWFGVFPIAGRLGDDLPSGWVEAGGFGLSMDVLGVALVLAAMIAAVHGRFRAFRRHPALLLRLAASLVSTTLFSVPLLTAVAAVLHDSTRPEALALEVVLAGSVLAATWRSRSDDAGHGLHGADHHPGSSLSRGWGR